MNEEKALKRLTDGLIAGTATFTASDAMAAQVATGQHEADPFMQVLIPVITGIVVPFLKEWALDMREKHKEKRRKRREAKEAVSSNA